MSELQNLEELKEYVRQPENLTADATAVEFRVVLAWHVANRLLRACEQTGMYPVREVQVDGGSLRTMYFRPIRRGRNTVCNLDGWRVDVRVFETIWPETQA